MKKINYLLLLLIIYFGCENNPITSIDCNGIENGTSIEDNCGICDDNSTNNCTQDCFGIWGGESIDDECGTCGGNGKLDCDNVCIYPDENGNYSNIGVDCFGICGGNVEVDECLVCNGPGAVYQCGCSGIEDGECDCDGNVLGCDNICASEMIEDCNGCGLNGYLGCVCDDANNNGICAELDANENTNNTCIFNSQNYGLGIGVDQCGECGGIGPETNYDCDGNCIEGFDDCGICGGDSSSCNSIEFDACSMPINYLYMIEGSVFYNVDFDIGGFQFDIDGTTVTGYSGGDAIVSGFTISVGGNTVLGFSFTGGVIPAGCGLLTELVLADNNDATGLSSITCSVGNSGTQSQTLEYYSGP